VNEFRTVLINNLVYNEEYARKVLPFIKDEYFHDKAERAVVELIEEHWEKYNAPPTTRSLLVDLSGQVVVSMKRSSRTRRK
jgi:mannose/fructose/N-acetylgalactosamine-specific phosphotransferase system component IID